MKKETWKGKRELVMAECRGRCSQYNRTETTHSVVIPVIAKCTICGTSRTIRIDTARV